MPEVHGDKVILDDESTGMAKLLIKALFYLIFFFGTLLGVFAAVGVCVVIWGPAILEMRMGNSPDYGHPSIWLMLGLMVPFMLVGFGGTFVTVCLPLWIRYPKIASVFLKKERLLLLLVSALAKGLVSIVNAQGDEISTIKS